MAARHLRLESVRDRIGLIRRSFGTPSISCGVLHHGEVIFHYAEGLADVEARLVPDADTIYPIASCSKAFTSAACAILENEGVISWAKPVSAYISEFETVHNKRIGQEATLVDMCSHSTGLAPVEHAILGFFDEYLNDGDVQVHVSSHLPVLYDFRTHFAYNNFLYGVVGEVIRRVCKKSLGSVMADKIFRPLGLHRTYTSPADHPHDGNIAKGYSILEDSTALPMQDPSIKDGSPQGAAGMVRSSVNDMLKWARAVMQAELGHFETTAGNPVEINPLQGIGFTRQAHMPLMPGPVEGENSYGLGWFRHTIPSRWLGFASPNFMLLPDPPVIGLESPPKLTICHSGAFGGFLTSFYTFPETCSAIIVFANSSPSRGDPADLVAQTLCQELFDMLPRVSLERYAVRAMETSRSIWPALVEEWVLARTMVTTTTAPAEYVGVYKNLGLCLRIAVFETPKSATSNSKSWGRCSRNREALTFSINNRVRQTARLKHYKQDIWSFLPNSRDDASRKGLELYMSLPLVLLSFKRDISGKIRWLDWDLYGASDQSVAHAPYQIQPTRFDRV